MGKTAKRLEKLGVKSVVIFMDTDNRGQYSHPMLRFMFSEWESFSIRYQRHEICEGMVGEDRYKGAEILRMRELYAKYKHLLDVGWRPWSEPYAGTVEIKVGSWDESRARKILDWVDGRGFLDLVEALKTESVIVKTEYEWGKDANYYEVDDLLKKRTDRFLYSAKAHEWIAAYYASQAERELERSKESNDSVKVD